MRELDQKDIYPILLELIVYVYMRVRLGIRSRYSSTSIHYPIPSLHLLNRHPNAGAAVYDHQISQMKAPPPPFSSFSGGGGPREDRAFQSRRCRSYCSSGLIPSASFSLSRLGGVRSRLGSRSGLCV